MAIRFHSIVAAIVSVLLLHTSGAVSPLVYPLAPNDNQQSQSKPFYRDVLISAAREIMVSARYCALITTDSAGRTHSRAMDPFSPEADMKVWFGTNPRSRKVKEIRSHPRVTLYYFVREDQAYVSLTGTARLVNDPREKAARFKDDWKAFYPDRARDYLLIEFTPEKLEVVSVKKGIVGDARTWQTPTVSFRTRTSRE
jgi:general stress protein 26